MYSVICTEAFEFARPTHQAAKIQSSPGFSFYLFICYILALPSQERSSLHFMNHPFPLMLIFTFKLRNTLRVLISQNLISSLHCLKSAQSKNQEGSVYHGALGIFILPTPFLASR